MRENRKFVRLKAPIGVVYSPIKNKRRKQQLSLLKNISGGGICITAKEDLREGDLLEMEIQIPHLEEPIEAVGEVMWFAAGDDEKETREAGIRFRDISPKDLHQVLEYVYTIGIGE